jgi:choline dehydrogenase-like flavoprotein
MFLDARTLSGGTQLEADLCIVGAGAAGISAALALDGSPLRVLLVESGGFHPDRETQALYAGSNVGLSYCPLDECRSRFFGGSTNCWGGWCKPFDPIDFDERAWLGTSGWPFGAEQLEPYRARAASLLQLGPLDRTPTEWEAAISNEKARLLPLEGTALENKIAQFSPPARFGRLYREPIERSRNVRTVLHANLVEIEADEAATSVTGLRLATLTGTTFSARARAYVLATGGVENPRLLLLSSRVATNGLGNVNDLVGRYFMDHPRIASGHFRPSPSTPSLDFYDVTYNVQNSAMMAHGVCAAAFFSIRADVQREEQLLNNRLFFMSAFAGVDGPGMEALRHVKAAAAYRTRSHAVLHEVPKILRHVDDVARASVARYLHPARLMRARRLVTFVEPDPNPDSRVTLSTSERDSLGLPRAIVDWRLGPHAERSFPRVQQVVAAELSRRGLGELVLSPEDPGEQIRGTWHHMGTTRMSRHAATGVVDPDCRVHGINNLYIAGSSVFPTVSSDMPTFMVVAMALRLAEHLREELTRRPHVAIDSAAV